MFMYTLFNLCICTQNTLKSVTNITILFSETLWKVTDEETVFRLITLRNYFPSNFKKIEIIFSMLICELPAL